MMFSKNILVILVVLSTISLCLAKPRWIWEDEEEEKQLFERDEDSNVEDLIKEHETSYDQSVIKKGVESYEPKSYQNLRKKGIKSYEKKQNICSKYPKKFC